MNRQNPWYTAKALRLQVSPCIRNGFDIGFDKRIPEETQIELRNFVVWVEANFNIPITLWVDFEYKHYLISRNRKKVGYCFYWADFSSYPVFDNEADIPSIRLPVRTEYSTTEEILAFFIEAITCYFIWLSNSLDPNEHYSPREEDVEEILQAYLNREAL